MGRQQKFKGARADSQIIPSTCWAFVNKLYCNFYWYSQRRHNSDAGYEHCNVFKEYIGL